MIDRFGLLPPQVGNLFQVSGLRLKAEALGIRAIEVGPEGGSIEFKENTLINPLTLVHLVQSDPKTFKLAGATRLRFNVSQPDGAARQRYVEELLETLATDAGGAKT
jgi:transcription-repair coupling factor (superfamily II helicase)